MRTHRPLALLLLSAALLPALVRAQAPTEPTPAKPTAARAAAAGFTPKLFDEFVAMRTGGTSGQSVWWYCTGELYSYPDGKLLALVEGVDAGRLLVPESHAGRDAVQLSRKTFVYRDVQTGAVLKEVDGKPLVPIAYPYQVIHYQLVGDRLLTSVEQGTGARLARIGPDERARVRSNGPDATVFSIPLFLNIETPRGKYEAYENYDFIVPAVRSKKEVPRYQLSWNRFGDLPPAFGTGKGVMQLVCRRVEKFSDLPAAIQTYITTEAPLYREAPRDMAEVRELQGAK
ncbi:MAG: DUF1838 family protein [Hymenobacteraceae bacterium]|nr:DUF1838 family protein [Hymenobacteraceae bacterium]